MNGTTVVCQYSGAVQQGVRRCAVCRRMGHNRRKCPRADLATRVRKFDAWLDLEWEDHDEAQRIVDENPDGMTLEEVGAVLGITRERVRQIEVVAFRKLREGLGEGQVVLVDGHLVVMLQCVKCGAWFMRRGRARLCLDCADPRQPLLPRGLFVTED